MTNQTYDPRNAGQVTRYHTWSRIREQSVGEHSWQVLRILLAIWPDAPVHVMTHCMTHDIGETVSGDPPYPVKVKNPVMKSECDRIEHEAHELMSREWMLPLPSILTNLERNVFKLAEFVEMWEWGLFEISMGNRNGELVASRCIEGMLQREKMLREGHPQNHAVAGVLGRCKSYTEKRTQAHSNIMRSGGSYD